MFTDIANPFGADAYNPVAIQIPSRTLYYRGLRLNRVPVRVRHEPKPVTRSVKNFLLDYNG